MFYKTVNIREIDINLTNRCNLECIHCAFSSSSIDRTELALDSVKRIVDEALPFGLEDVHFTGGEPTLYAKLPEAVEYAANLGLATKLITNGLALSEELLRSLKDRGLKNIMFSVDGREDIHNRIRGNRNSYQKVIEAIRTARTMGFGVKVNSVVSRINKDEIIPLLGVLQGLDIKVYQFFLYSPTGRNAQGQFGNVLSPPEWRDFLGSVRKYIADSGMSRPEVVAERGYLWDGEAIDESSYQGRGGGCYYLGQRCDYLVVLPSGHVYSCALLSDKGIPLGDINGRSLGEILESPDNADVYRSFTQGSDACASCASWQRCRGGCKAFSMAYHGTPGRSDPRCSIPAGTGAGYIPLCCLYKVNLMTGREGGYSERVVVEN